MNEIYMYGTIWEETAKEFASFISQSEGEIKVRINSVGGDVFAALAIYNLLKEYQGNVIVQIDGLCASAATLIMLAGDKIVAAKNTMLMIHLPSAYLSGVYKNAELSAAKNELEALESLAVGMYQEKTKLSAEEITKLMAAETWLLSEQALSLGFIDEVTEMSANIFDKPEEKKPVENKALAYFAKVIQDNLKSGAEGVLTDINPRSEIDKVATMIAKFAK